jgi:hypothetical protein
MTTLLSERALLVRPSISMWRGEILDKAASRDTAERHQADRGQVKTTKYLIPKAALDPIGTCANSLRSFVRQETLPWRWDGVSLLPTENYMNFCEGWRRRRLEFDAAVRALTNRWLFHVNMGKRALGNLAKDFEYPTAEQVASLYEARVEMFPVPDGVDFRAQVTASEAEAIRENLQVEAEAELVRVQSYMWEQMQVHVSRIVERLSEYEKDDSGKVTKGRIHDSLIGNLQLLVDRLSRLNIAKDPAIEAMRQELDAKLCGHTAEDLKADDVLRGSVKDAALDILEQFKHIAGVGA